MPLLPVASVGKHTDRILPAAFRLFCFMSSSTYTLKAWHQILCLSISVRVSAVELGNVLPRSVPQEGSWRMEQVCRDEVTVDFPAAVPIYAASKLSIYHAEHHSCILKMPFSVAPFGRASWAFYPVSDESHHTLQTRTGSTPSKQCPSSLAQARRGTGRAVLHHMPAWTQIKFSHFWVAASPC